TTRGSRSRSCSSTRRTASAAQSQRRSRSRSSSPSSESDLYPVGLMAVTDALIGTLFDGRYKVIRRLGSGGMANVYLAEDQELGRRIAIKILNDRHAHDEQFVERFRREAKSAAGLSHPNVVSIYDRGEAEGSYYIAMEYLDG